MHLSMDGVQYSIMKKIGLFKFEHVLKTHLFKRIMLKWI